MIGCSSCAIENKIYYFGGYCGHDCCNHNSLSELNVDEFKWRECLATGAIRPMKKGDCGMVAIHHLLFVIGGFGNRPINPQPSAQYSEGEFVYTNEHHFYAIGTGELRSVMTCAVGGCRMFVCVCVCVCVSGWLL